METVNRPTPKAGEWNYSTRRPYTTAEAKALAKIKEIALKHGLLTVLEGQGWSAPGVYW
jgi:hypothetical protein